MLNVAIIGLGNISNAHIPAWREIENTQIVAVCDIRSELFEKVPEARSYTNYCELLEKEQVDIVDICLPTFLHVEVSLAALKKGIHVLCEKPISLNPEDAQLLYRTAQEHNVRFMVAQVIRFWPEYVALKQMADTQKYGKLLSGVMQRIGSIPRKSWNNWMLDGKISGGVPYDLHIHDLDFAVHAFGVPTKMESHRAVNPQQDYVHAVYTYPDFWISIEASWYACAYPFRMSFRFQFEQAVVTYENGKLTVYENSGAIYEPLAANLEQNYGADNLPCSDGYGNEIRYFVDCVCHGTSPDMVKPEELKAVLQLLKNF